MKRIYRVMIAFMVTVLVACKKNKDDPKKELISTWELAEHATSCMPRRTYEPGNGNLLKFEDDMYIAYKGSQVLEQGSYTTAPDNSEEARASGANLENTHMRSIEFTYGDTILVNSKSFYYIADSRLYMMSGCSAVDGLVYKIYRRANQISID